MHWTLLNQELLTHVFIGLAAKNMHKLMFSSRSWTRAAAASQGAPQCLKCRTPLSTITTSRSSAAAMTSASRMLPPG